MLSQNSIDSYTDEPALLRRFFSWVKEKSMRLDKYLKTVRLIKRRTVANEACDAGRIEVNGKVARASYEVKVGDLIAINMGSRPLTVKVLAVNEVVTKENAGEGYQVVE